jgi:D-amino-acid dehydrogenase
MKVIVLGGGVIGVTTAWALRARGHEVALLERHPAVGAETSHANGGQISWGAANPWAAPGLPWQALAWLVRPHSPLAFRPRLDPAMWAWLLRMLGQCTARRYARNKERMIRLAHYSHAQLVRLREETGITYDATRHGTLWLFRKPSELRAAAGAAQSLARWGVATETLDRDGCLAVEPGLAHARAPITGGLRFPGDEAGDCLRFTEQLAERAAARGVQCHFNSAITGFVTEGSRIRHVMTAQGEHTADAFVLATGCDTPLLLKPLGVTLPVYPVKGYSLTIPVTDPAAAPRGTLTDEHYKVVLTRLGDRLRVAGTAELAGHDRSLRESRLATLRHVVNEIFPRAGDLARAEPWAGLRPMTPDNPPVLGATPFRNLFVNTGHGTLGWTQSVGSASVIADLVSGQTPAIDLDGLTLARFR